MSSVLWLALTHAAIIAGPADGADATATPTVGEAMQLTVTDEAAHPLPGQTVRVVHRPGLAEEQEQAIGITDARGKVEWTPAAAGIARVRAGQQVQVVHVEGPTPVGTWVVGTLLLLLGVGSVGWGLRSGARMRRRA